MVDNTKTHFLISAKHYTFAGMDVNSRIKVLKSPLVVNDNVFDMLIEVIISRSNMNLAYVLVVGNKAAVGVDDI